MKTLRELFKPGNSYSVSEVFEILAKASLDGEGLRDASDFHAWFDSLAAEARIEEAVGRCYPQRAAERSS